ncbi:hypothetical protein [Teredinibacter haidensis]|uniref:hypothetical protein n=1 Tax=Teredinibacter haidensis TaxID=2731755 RepID=UPI000948E583|nr:hypothetical protein [Teredinibacter haidensis]
MKLLILLLALALFGLSDVSFSVEDRIDLETTTIKGNTELPKILYVVPWKDAQDREGKQQKLVLHSLFGDLFDPISPMEPTGNRLSGTTQQ